MAVEVIMPQMGESITEGTITKWYKKVGEQVERDEPLFEISTDKVDTEIPSPSSGVLTEIKVGEGETVPINTIVALIGAEGEEAAAESPPSPAPAEEAGVAETAEVTESVSPSMAPEERAPAPPEPGVASMMQPTSGGERLRSSPLVRRIAREHGVDLARVPGTGRDGRVTKADILDFIEKGPPTPEMPAPEEAMVAEAAPQPSAPAPAARAPAGPAGTTRAERVPMSVMRKSIAEHMLSSRRTSAHVATVFEADVTRIVTVRENYKDRYVREEGAKLTYTPFFIRAVVGGLKAFPIINASIEGDEIVYKKDINIGIAVALDWGLIVPVIKNADEKSFLKLNRDVSDLAERARTKKLLPEEVQGGTFTITNPGPYGGLFGLPIINQPQVAILGLGGIHKRPVVVNDAIAIRSMVYLALSFDHRLVDGATADQFMAEVKKRLENWEEKIL
jgi:2-oxoglutarate dehydrogenase E2 component (dihydrolipoamide succinyltransferase)